MKKLIPSLLIISSLLSLSACLKPDAIENDTVVDVTYVDLLETQGYARDVVVHNDKAIVAASQAGNQIWDVAGTEPEKIFQHYFSANPALRVTLEPETGLLFAFDKSQGFYKAMNSDYSGFDSVYIDHEIWITLFESGLFGSGSNEDFVARKFNDSLVALYVIDRTSNDGLKQYYFNRRYETLDGGFHYWELNNVGVSTGGINLGMDMRDSLIAISHDELGVGLYALNGVALDTLASSDTRGEALEVTFYGDYLLSANNWAGLGIFRMDLNGGNLMHVADLEVNGWVKQIVMWNDIAILSCGENSIFLVDLSDPEHPVVDQSIDAGYTYTTFVSGDMLYAATREGVKRYQLQSR